ncbi:MAG TPA: hypothetical protein PKD85_23945, partial [Saprospiraceae bacterium]|nr:hypothetical protein [Saprospiraceae bacterium]
MTINESTLFGHEWINKEKDYNRFYINQDGIYRINKSKLIEIGIKEGDINKIQLWNFGKQVPVFIEDEYIEFIGFRNTIGLDTFLYQN